MTILLLFNIFQDKSLESHNYFFLFGGGIRLCPGKELGIAEVSTFLHYFVTKYRYVAFFSIFYVFFLLLTAILICTFLSVSNSDCIFCWIRKDRYDPTCTKSKIKTEIVVKNFCFVFCCRWEEVGECKLLKFPRVKARNGFHIRVSSY